MCLCVHECIYAPTHTCTHHSMHPETRDNFQKLVICVKQSQPWWWDSVPSELLPAPTVNILKLKVLLNLEKPVILDFIYCGCLHTYKVYFKYNMFKIKFTLLTFLTVYSTLIKFINFIQDLSSRYYFLFLNISWSREIGQPEKCKLWKHPSTHVKSQGCS